jgi:putative ABC transport system permease protein
VLAVSADYFRLLQIPLLRGRSIRAGDGVGAPTVAVLSRAAADAFWPQRDPLGRRLTLLHWDEPLEATVVGVVEDVREHGPAEAIEPAVYFSHAQFADRVLGLHFLLRSPGNPSSLAASAQAVVRGVDPDQPPSGVATLEGALANAVAQRRLNALLVAVFAATALLLVVAGIQGVVSLSVAERTREIGLRIALGASRGHVVARTAAQVLRPAVIGLAAGVVGALLAGRAMSGLLFGVAPSDPGTLAGTAVVVLAVAALAAWLPARRAARVDPLIALRSE